MIKGFENFDYGDDITHLSEPDHDSLMPLDSSWSCLDWKLYYEALEDEYGSSKARDIWNEKWQETPTYPLGFISRANNLRCKYTDDWRSWADSKGLVYDHLILGQLDSWIQGTTESVGGAVTGGVGAVEFLTKNLKWILLGGLVFIGAYAYKNFIKGNQQIKFKIK